MQTSAIAGHRETNSCTLKNLPITAISTPKPVLWGHLVGNATRRPQGWVAVKSSVVAKDSIRYKLKRSTNVSASFIGVVMSNARYAEEQSTNIFAKERRIAKRMEGLRTWRQAVLAPRVKRTEEKTRKEKIEGKVILLVSVTRYKEFKNGNMKNEKMNRKRQKFKKLSPLGSDLVTVEAFLYDHDFEATIACMHCRIWQPILRLVSNLQPAVLVKTTLSITRGSRLRKLRLYFEK